MSYAAVVDGGEMVEPNVGRFYTKKIEVIADRITEETIVYPIGQNSQTAKKRAIVYSEVHYEVYKFRVGDDDYKVFQYDEYHTTWKGQEKKDGKWVTTVAKKSEVSRERSPVVEILGWFV